MGEKVKRASDKRLRDQLTRQFKWPSVQTTVPENQEAKVPEDGQMLVFNELIIDGELKIDGEVVIFE